MMFILLVNQYTTEDGMSWHKKPYGVLADEYWTDVKDKWDAFHKEKMAYHEHRKESGFYKYDYEEMSEVIPDGFRGVL